MVVYGSAQVFQVATSASVTAPRSNVVATALSGDVGQLLASPEIIQSLQAAIELDRIRLPVPEILIVDRQDVGNVDLLYLARLARGAVLCGDILCELAFCCCNFALSASCGDMFIAVENDPGGLANGAVTVTSFGAEPKPDSLLSS
jgi:hypothetical protein